MKATGRSRVSCLRLSWLLLGLTHGAGAAGASAQTPRLVKDIDTQGGMGSSPTGFVEMGGAVYFFATRASEGRELWASDGTPAGTHLVKDVCPGTCGSEGTELIADAAGGCVFFLASSDGFWPLDLWVSDGTEAGTLRILDARAFSSSPDTDSLVVSGGRLFFRLRESATGSELWSSDGTPGGTGIVRDISPGSGGATPSGLTDVGGILYFAADDGASGSELWRSDGTSAGTYQIADLWPGADGGGFTPLGVLGAKVLFMGSDSASGLELWQSSGTAASTVLVKDICPGSCSSYDPRKTFSVTQGGVVFFTADDGQSGFELWASDGTASGTVPLADIYPGSQGSDPEQLRRFGTELAFTAESLPFGRKLWRSDGTQAGTRLLVDLAPGGQVPIEHLTGVGGALYFTTWLGNGKELWVSDGTPAGTVEVVDIAPGALDSSPSALSAGLGKLFFAATDGTSGPEPWLSDGTPGGTYALGPLNPSATSGSEPGQLVELGGRAYFHTRSMGIWSSDGTTSGTVEFASGASAPVVVGSRLFFLRTEPATGTELWVSDGTPGGTTLVKDLCPGSCSSSIGLLTPIGNRLFMAVADSSSGLEAWASDGTPAGTTLLADICPGPCSGFSLRGTFGDLGGRAVFSAREPTLGHTLWISDGTPAGTRLLLDLDPLGQGRSVDSFAALGNKLLFPSFDAASALEPWWTDGVTSAQLLDLCPGNCSSLTDVSDSVELGLRLLLPLREPSVGTELFETDLTASGTRLVADVRPGPADAILGQLTRAGAEVYFIVAAPTGTELWASDGTGGGTRLVGEVDRSGFSSRERHLTAFGVGLYLTGTDLVTGTELWRSDGTAAGTGLVADIRSGRESSEPGDLLAVGSTLFFTADDGSAGRELWAVDASDRIRGILRSDGIASLAPVTPPLGSLLPLQAPRDRYLPSELSGTQDPELGVLGDASRPLVLYALDAPGVLRLTKRGARVARAGSSKLRLRAGSAPERRAPR